MINHANVARTCGRCHQDIYGQYQRSIHGRALEAGLHESPTCNDCHGEHLILSSDDPDAATFAATQAEETCANCHDDPEMVAKYGFREEVVASYLDSYHGWATRGGYVLAASCSDCHTSHLILPESDSTSSIHPARIVETCGLCHEGADTEFAASYTHAATAFSTNPLNQLVRRVYLTLIVVLIGGMLLHNMVIMYYYLAKRRREAGVARAVLRFDRIQIVQHIATLLSFWLLVVTGFALRFPEAWWVQQLAGLGLTEPVRSTVHRVCGVVLILVSISHVLYVLLSRRGQEEFRAMVPRWQDAKDFVANMKYYLRISPKRARFGRYDYTQKAEYWALVWGTAVMALTGAVLWFPTLAVKLLPAISVTISQTIHYYEAWLATLAIVVWHFFFVFFYPGEYPMSWTWLSGKMSERTVRRHHARWYDEEIDQPTGTTDETTERHEVREPAL
jgi:formate dehydrogenase gamma subunit